MIEFVGVVNQVTETQKYDNTRLKDGITIDNGFKTTLKMNGNSIYSNVDIPFVIRNASNLSITGPGMIEKTLEIENGSSLTVSSEGELSMDTVINSGTLTIGNGIPSLTVEIKKDSKTLFNGTDMELKLVLDEEVSTPFNDESEGIEDLILLDGTVPEELMQKISVEGITNPLSKVVYRDGKIVLTKTKIDGVVFIDGQDGNDADDGLTIKTPKKTYAAAVAKTDELGIKILEVIGHPIEITEDTELSGGYTIERYPNYTGILMNIDKAEVTVRDFTEH